MRTLTEQPVSLHAALAKAGLKHGDTAEVRMGVGVHRDPKTGSPIMAFCSSVFRLLRVIREGDPEEREMPIVGEVIVEKDELLAEALTGVFGFVGMRAFVHTNGSVQITPHVSSVRQLEGVSDEDVEYTVNNTDGIPYSEMALALVK